MRTLTELETELWVHIETATQGRNPYKLAQLGRIAQDIERKTAEWDAMFEVALRENNRTDGAAPVVESIKPTNGDGRLRDYQNVKIRGFEFDGERFSHHTYKGLLVALAEILRKQHAQRFDECVLRFGGRSRRYFSRKADDLKFAHPLGAGLFVETNLNANLIVKICYDMIRELGYPETKLKIECGQGFDESLIG